jgi:hypothetical protein
LILAVAQVAFVVAWLHTHEGALVNLRVLFFRTVMIMGYGWFMAATSIPRVSLLALVCDWLVVIHIIGLALAVLNCDPRLFPLRGQSRKGKQRRQA